MEARKAALKDAMLPIIGSMGVRRGGRIADIELFCAIVEAGGISAGAWRRAPHRPRSAAGCRRSRRGSVCGWPIAARGASA